MAKEWDKFSSDDKKLAPKIESTAPPMPRLPRPASTRPTPIAAGGERNLPDCMIDAHNAGVTGTTLVEYMKNKTFAEGCKQDTATSNDKIETALDAIGMTCKTSESKVRGAATTLKKAG